MRLLKLEDNGQITLTKDLNNDGIPPYAILSHTWGDDDQEVTFKDATANTEKQKAGYEKIRFCGQQALSDGLQYFWVDTCCIDKSNNTELSEAINSMFRWYQNATRCYVYLSDVSTDGLTQTALSPMWWQPAFRASRWFTRGWTLQELMAPASVEFFSSEGERLGDKTSLELQLHSITHIPISAFQGHLSEFSALERMSWSGGRQTTRAEDGAYSLMGIFGVYMPLIYGEGKENAFIRLRKKVDNRLGNRPAPLPSHDPTRANEAGASRKFGVGVGRSTFSQVETNFTMKAHNVQDIVFPLLVLRPNLSKILPHLVDGGEMNLRGADVAWLKDEIEGLLASAHAASVHGNAEQVTRTQLWHSIDESVAPRSKTKRKAQDEGEDGTGLSCKKRRTDPASSSLFSSRTEKPRSRRYETREGNLLVRTELRQGGIVLFIYFSFTPNDNISPEYRNGFTTVLRRNFCNQRIERCLRTFRIVEWEGSAFEAVENGDLLGLQTLLSKQTAFPTDRLLDDGNTLIGHACREVQLPICEFLLTSLEGTDPCESDSEGMNALRSLIQGFQDEELIITEFTKPDQRQNVVSALVQGGCLEDEAWPEREAEDGCLHLSGFLEQSTYPADELSGMISEFIKHGAELEIRDSFGKTPLLDNLSIPGELGLEVIDKLLEGRADTKAVDNDGNGVFHLVLEACQNIPDNLVKRLPLLMKYSFLSDLSKTNSQGYTPSDFAFTVQLWPVWCKAVSKKIPLERLLIRDHLSKTDYQDQMSRPEKPITQKITSKLDLSRRKEYRGEVTSLTPENLNSDSRHETPNQQCCCNNIINFVRWVAQDTPGQQLPGLPRCLTCGGYVLPADMENRKRRALSNPITSLW